MRRPKNHRPAARQPASETVRPVRGEAGAAPPQQPAGKCAPAPRAHTAVGTAWGLRPRSPLTGAGCEPHIVQLFKTGEAHFNSTFNLCS